MSPLKVPIEAAEAFINQRPTSSMKVSCILLSDISALAVCDIVRSWRLKN